MTASETTPTEPSAPMFGFPPIVGAILGAAIGASAWALIAHFTGYEVGYVAWGVGALVGFGSTSCGGKGASMGLACAALALVAIFVGKVGAVQLTWGSVSEEIADEMFNQEVYDQYLEVANALPQDAGERALKGFMLEHGVTDATHVDEISAEEFAQFRDDDVPELKALRDDPPGFDAWNTEHRADFETAFEQYAGEISVNDQVIESLAPMDLLFVGLGVWTAWRMGGGGEKPHQRGDSGASARARRSRRDDE